MPTSRLFLALVAVLAGGCTDVLAANFWLKLRYALQYRISSEKVKISDKPHDCAFLSVPLGEKYCHYAPAVATLRWATSTTGNPIFSYDEGKTWSTFTPAANVAVPKYSTVEEVYVVWERKED